MRHWFMIPAAGMVALCTSFSSAAVTSHTTVASFDAANGVASTLDDLSSYGTVSLNLGTNAFPSGYSIDLAGASDGSTELNGATNLVFTLAPGGLDSLTFNFDQPIVGFGATWLNSFVSNGLNVTIDGQTTNLESIIAEPNFDFIGFSSDVPFTTATVTLLDPAGSSEFAAISEVYFAVPAPGSAAALGLAGVALIRRRR
ncbi:MAG: hypothetical protein AAFX05_02100 [Planctomycetota bacterium]